MQLLQYVVPQDITLYRYADDHLASKKAKVSQLPGAIEDLEHCMTDVKSWMNENLLKMNSDKTEFLVVGWSRMICKCESDTITVTGDTIQRSKCIKCLGTWIDENLSFKEHIKRKCGIAMGNIQILKRIKKLNISSLKKPLLQLLWP